MNRGHYATALRAFRNLAKKVMLRQKTTLATLYERGLEFRKTIAWP